MYIARKQSLVVGAAVSLAISCCAFAGDQSDHHDKAQDVNVVNKPAVRAEQSGAWKVGVNGTVNVDVGGMPDVTIGNTTINPIPVHVTNNASDSGVPFLRDLSTIGLHLPADKRAIIEFVSARCILPLGADLTGAGLVVTNDNSGMLETTHFFLALPLMAQTATAKIYATGQVVQIYAEPGSLVTGTYLEEGGHGECQWSISGRMISASP